MNTSDKYTEITLTWNNKFDSRLFEVHRKTQTITVSEYEQTVCNIIKYLDLDCSRSPTLFFVHSSPVILHVVEVKKKLEQIYAGVENSRTGIQGFITFFFEME